VSTAAQPSTNRLPRGPHSLSREQVESHQRERILAAVTAMVGSKGYAATTIGDISGHARVSRDTFYEQFKNKEDAFVAAYDAITRDLLAKIVAVGTSQASYVDAVRDGVRVYLEFWAEHPEAARVCTLEVMAAGENALAQRERTLRGFARLFRNVAERAAEEQPKNKPKLPSIPDIVSRASILTVQDLATEYVSQGRTDEMQELENEVVYLWLLGIAGHEVAARATKAPA
jgi:AcrR family transcriptional regulator